MSTSKDTKSTKDSKNESWATAFRIYPVVSKSFALRCWYAAIAERITLFQDSANSFFVLFVSFVVASVRVAMRVANIELAEWRDQAESEFRPFEIPINTFRVKGSTYRYRTSDQSRYGVAAFANCPTRQASMYFWNPLTTCASARWIMRWTSSSSRETPRRVKSAAACVATASS